MHTHLPLCVGILTTLSWSAACGLDEGSLPPELPAYAEPPCELSSRSYRIDALELPRSAPEAYQLGLDLDADELDRPDNAAGQVYSMIAGQYEGRIEQLHASLAEALAGGRIHWVLEVQTCADDPHARVALRRATDFDGDGVLRIVPYGYLPAVGERTELGITARDGTAAAPVSALFDVLGVEPDVTWVDGHALAIDIEGEPGDAPITGRLGLGLDDRAFGVAAEPLAALLTELLALGASDYAVTLDADGDGVVTAGEITSDQYMSLLGAPDLDLLAPAGGVWVYWPNRDGIEDSISIGIGFTAVPVELE